MKLSFASLAGMAVILFSLPLAASAGTAEMSAPMPEAGTGQVSSTLQPCAVDAAGKLNVAQTSQTECCKGHKGICGCRAGKIVCCDGTASEKCTCHGDEGFLE